MYHKDYPKTQSSLTGFRILLWRPLMHHSSEAWNLTSLVHRWCHPRWYKRSQWRNKYTQQKITYQSQRGSHTKQEPEFKTDLQHMLLDILNLLCVYFTKHLHFLFFIPSADWDLRKSVLQTQSSTADLWPVLFPHLRGWMLLKSHLQGGRRNSGFSFRLNAFKFTTWKWTDTIVRLLQIKFSKATPGNF